MYIARIKIKLEDNYENIYYEKEKWFDLFEYNGKKCKWRIKKNGVIDFIIGNYENRYEALEDGKILYFNILYEIHRSDERFELGESNYITKLYHENRGYTFNEFIENEEWFFNTKRDSADFLGLGIYEIEKSMEEYDEYGKIFADRISVMNEKPFSFLENITKMDTNYKYSEKSQKIFNIVRLAEETDLNTKLLLLCQALERMGENAKRPNEEIDVLKECIKCIEKSNLTEEQKGTLKNMLNQGKNISSKNKCKNLIEKYCRYEYKRFDKIKVFNEAYTLRGKIIHGEDLGDDVDLSCIYYLKVMVLDILKEWSKDDKCK